MSKLEEKNVSTTNVSTPAVQPGTAARCSAETLTKSAAATVASNLSAAAPDDNSATAAAAPPKPTTTDVFAASPLSTAVLISASVPRPYGAIPAVPSQHRPMPAMPIVAMSTTRTSSAQLQGEHKASDNICGAAADRLPDAPATTAVVINRGAPWISLPRAGRDDVLDLRGLSVAPILAHTPPLHLDTERRPAVPASIPPAGLPVIASDLQSSAATSTLSLGAPAPAAPAGAATAWANDQRPIRAGTAQLIPSQLPALQAQPSAPAGAASAWANDQAPIRSGTAQLIPSQLPASQAQPSAGSAERHLPAASSQRLAIAPGNTAGREPPSGGLACCW